MRELLLNLVTLLMVLGFVVILVGSIWEMIFPSEQPTYEYGPRIDYWELDEEGQLVELNETGQLVPFMREEEGE